VSLVLAKLKTNFFALEHILCFFLILLSGWVVIDKFSLVTF
jgi:hypothetical protein